MILKNINSFVFFGGGTGLSRILKPFIFSNNIPLNSDISAVVSTFDNGGSSGILRSEYGIPALGDIRKVLSSLSSDINSKFLEYRFRNKPLNQHVVGNLILNSYLKKTNSLKSAIEKYKKKFSEKHISIIPSSIISADLVAKFKEELIFGECNIEKIAEEQIDDLYLHSKTHTNINSDEKTIKIIKNSSYIFFSPGSFYTSLMASVLPVGIIEAIKFSNAKTVLFQNRDKKNFMIHFDFLIHKLNGFTPDYIASSNYELRDDIENNYPQTKFIYHDFFSTDSKVHDFENTKSFFESFLESKFD